MGVLIDASILIEAERGRLDLSSRIREQDDEDFFLSVVTASELLHGVHRARDPEVRARRSVFVEAVLSQFPILEIDVATARLHAQVWAGLAAQGIIIGPNDLWLAASCLSHGHWLLTANVREFKRVSGLIVEIWS